MQRLWSDTRLYIVSSDSGFIRDLVKGLPSTYDVTQIDPERLTEMGAAGLDSSLVFWDVIAYPLKRLELFLTENPNFSRNCSLLLLIPDCEIPGLTEVLRNGAVDFILRNCPPSEMKLRLDLARRPWVKGMATAFEFLAGINVDLTMTEQKVFLCFLKSPDFSAARKDIMETVWGASMVHPNTLDVHLFNIRRKLEPGGIRITFTSAKSCWILSKSERKAVPTESSEPPQDGPFLT